MAGSPVEATTPIRVVDASMAPGFIGFIICLGLYGVGLAQTVYYYHSFPHDGRFKKLFVSCLFLVELLDTSALWSMFWDALIYNRFRGPDATPTSAVPWQLYFHVVMDGLIPLLVQGFFCLRVWRVSHGNVVLALTIAISSIVHIAVLIAEIALTEDIFDSKTNVLAHFQFGTALLCDGTIAGSLVYYFNSSRLGMPRTEPVMRQLIWLSVNTGLLICLVTALTYIMYETKPVISLAPDYILNILYYNSMMAALNSRRHFRAIINRSVHSDDYSSVDWEASKIATD